MWLGVAGADRSRSEPEQNPLFCLGYVRVLPHRRCCGAKPYFFPNRFLDFLEPCRKFISGMRLCLRAVCASEPSLNVLAIVTAEGSDFCHPGPAALRLRPKRAKASAARRAPRRPARPLKHHVSSPPRFTRGEADQSERKRSESRALEPRVASAQTTERMMSAFDSDACRSGD